MLTRPAPTTKTGIKTKLILVSFTDGTVHDVLLSSDPNELQKTFPEINKNYCIWKPCLKANWDEALRWVLTMGITQTVGGDYIQIKHAKGVRFK